MKRYLNYNIVSISGVQQSDLVCVCVCVHVRVSLSGFPGSTVISNVVKKKKICLPVEEIQETGV